MPYQKYIFLHHHRLFLIFNIINSIFPLPSYIKEGNKRQQARRKIVTNIIFINIGFNYDQKETFANSPGKHRQLIVFLNRQYPSETQNTSMIRQKPPKNSLNISICRSTLYLKRIPILSSNVADPLQNLSTQQKVNRFQFQSQNFNTISSCMLATPPVANFVQKTFEILRLEEHSSVIAWLPSGREFIIKASEIFETTTLPRYFRHRNVNSFIRQLNMYGFHKSRREPTKLIFSHPCFLQGREDLLVLVKRKLKNEAEREEEQLDLEERVEDKSELLTSQATKFSLEPEERMTQEHQTQLNHPSSILPTPCAQKTSQDMQQIFAINSFFNIDYESIQLKNLVSNRSYIFDGNSEAYLRMEEAPSLREIGTEEYLCTNNHRESRKDGRECFPVRIFETRNCMLDFDI